MERRATERGSHLADPDPSEVDTRSGFPYADLLRPPYLGRVIVFLAMWFFWYIGNYGFLGDAADLFKTQGLSAGTAYLAIGAVGYPVGAAIMIVGIDRYERKWLLLASSVVWLVGMLLVGAAASEAVVIVGAFLASTALGMFLQVGYTYTAESFPTRARPSGFALCDGLGHGGGALGGLLLPSIVTSLSFSAGFAIIGVTGLIAGLIAIAGPTTRGISLERISA